MLRLSYTLLLLGVVDFRSRMLAFRGACGEPPWHKAPAGSHLQGRYVLLRLLEILSKRVSSSHALREEYSGSWHAPFFPINLSMKKEKNIYISEDM